MANIVFLDEYSLNDADLNGKRESRIVHERRGAVDLAVGTAVVAVHVAEFGRGDHRVVKRRIENAARGVVRSLDAHLLQLGDRNKDSFLQQHRFVLTQANIFSNIQSWIS